MVISFRFIPFLVLLSMGCDEERAPEESASNIDPPAEEAGEGAETVVDTGDAPVGAECDGQALCARSIDECEVNLDLETCLSFYDTATTTCADIDAYVECNCDCIEEDTCDGYFACGQVCFTLRC
ncbi:MAG: hypothetical protein AAFV53_33055 [Myxococcota bacterium]